MIPIALVQLETPDAPEAVTRFLERELFRFGETPVTPMVLIAVALVILTTVVISKLAQRGTRRALTFNRKANEATVAVTVRLVHYIVMVIGIGIALETIGLNLGTLFTAGAFFAIALGFAMQNIAQNFISGVVLMTERTVKPGDVLEVGGTVVLVSHLGLRATIAGTWDDEDLIIPNSELVQTTVTNFTLRDSNYRLRTRVTVSFRSDMGEVAKVLQETAEGFAQRTPHIQPIVFMNELGDSGVVFEVSVWIPNPWNAPRVRSDLNVAIWTALKAAGIMIALPQRDVHFVPPPE